jgi:8-amino-7-oxononanoate synthase
MELNAILQYQLLKRKEEGNWRELKYNKDLIDFSSNDYLGFARNSNLKLKAQEILKNHEDSNRINGATGSRLISGQYPLYEKVEKYIASFHHAESALIFNSGYDANLGFFSCIPQKGDTILFDRLIHASIHDGIRLSKAQAMAFKHNDTKHLNELKEYATGNVFVVAESIYSMDGDAAPIEELIKVCKKNAWYLIIDEAHALGVCGNKNGGLIDNKSLAESCFARLYTFGKVIGAHGAAIVGSKLLTDYLINFSRPFIYTTALPPEALAHIQAAYQYLPLANEESECLRKNIQLFKELMLQNQITTTESNSAIQCMLIPGNEQVNRTAIQLQSKGFDIRAIRSPTVKKGSERLRICLHSFNSEEEIKNLINACNGLF